jgi:hypothetical protein
MADTLTDTVNGCTVIANPMPTSGSRWGYEVRGPTGEVLYLSPYRWSSATAALQAGRKDAEEWEPPAPRLGRPPVAENARVVDVTLPEDLIRRIDYARGSHGQSRAAAIRDALEDTFGSIDLPADVAG